MLFYRYVVDEAAVGAAHVDECHAVWRDQQPRMIAAYCTGTYAHVALAGAADRDDVARERNGTVGPIQRQQLRADMRRLLRDGGLRECLRLLPLRFAKLHPRGAQLTAQLIYPCFAGRRLLLQDFVIARQSLQLCAQRREFERLIGEVLERWVAMAGRPLRMLEASAQQSWQRPSINLAYWRLT